MNLSDPIGTVIPSAHGPVLEVLARTDVPLTGRAVAALTEGRVSHARTRQVLLDLVASGLVSAQEAPPARLYRLNRQHLAADAVTALASLRSTLLDRMRANCRSWVIPARAVWLFGSLARGESTGSSDIDVLVVRPDRVEVEDPDWARQLGEFAELVRAWTGNTCELLEYAEGELSDRLDTRLAADVRDHGVVLGGVTPAALLRSRSRRGSRA